LSASVIQKHIETLRSIMLRPKRCLSKKQVTQIKKRNKKIKDAKSPWPCWDNDRIRCADLGCVSKIGKAHFRRLNLHIFVKRPRRSTTAPAFFASICKPIQQYCIF
jgi:hypothetical protein